MSVSVNQRWPDGLRERVAKVAGSRGVTRFTVEALEAALADKATAVEGVRELLESHGGPELREKLRETPQVELERPPGSFRCPTPGCLFTALSSAATCGAHGRRVVPA